MTEHTSTNRPGLNIFAKVPQSDGTTRIGSQIGVGFPFETNMNTGFNLVFDAQPVPNPSTGRIELVAFPPKTKG